MPYGSFHTGDDDAVRNALRLVKEGGAQAVKIEGGEFRAPAIKALVQNGIPVMGHIGLTPQSVKAFGGYKAVEPLQLNRIQQTEPGQCCPR